MKKICSIVLLFSVTQWAVADVVVMSLAQQKKLNVQVVTLDKKDVGSLRKFTAVVAIPTTQDRIVSAPQHGLIDALFVATGQSVKKGQAVAHLSSPELVALQREYLQAGTQHKLTEKALLRDSGLYQEGIIAERRYLETSSAQEEVSATLAAKKQALRMAGMGDVAIAQLETSKSLQSGLTLTAPVTGQILEQMVTVGQRVEGATPLYRIVQMQPLWLEIHAPVDALMSLKEGMPVTVAKLKASGKIITILRNVNPANQMVNLRAQIDQGAGNLTPGQFVEAEIQLDTPSQSYAVPSAALVRHGKQLVIFKQVTQGFEPVPVTVVAEQDQQVIVAGALNGKEKIAVTGLATLKGSWLGLGASDAKHTH